MRVPLWEYKWHFEILSDIRTKELWLTMVFRVHITVSALHLQEEIKKKLKHCIAAFALSFFQRLYIIETSVGFCYVQSGTLLGTVKISKILN